MSADITDTISKSCVLIVPEKELCFKEDFLVNRSSKLSGIGIVCVGRFLPLRKKNSSFDKLIFVEGTFFKRFFTFCKIMLKILVTPKM